MRSRKLDMQKWRKTPKGIYSTQRTNALARNIKWELTFEEWWNIWTSSGKWEERGTDTFQYCMCRNNDIGPYSISNVRIDTNHSNKKENFSILKRENGRVQSKKLNINDLVNELNSKFVDYTFFDNYEEDRFLNPPHLKEILLNFLTERKIAYA